MQQLMFKLVMFVVKWRVKGIMLKLVSKRELDMDDLSRVISVIPTIAWAGLSLESLAGKRTLYPGNLSDTMNLAETCKFIVRSQASIPAFIMHERFLDLRSTSPLAEILSYEKPGRILWEAYESLYALHLAIEKSGEERRMHYNARVGAIYTAFAELVITVILAN